MENHVLPCLFVLALGLLAVLTYATKRYFDDRAAGRVSVENTAGALVAEMELFRTQVVPLLDANASLVRDRLGVFEKALANAISQFAEIVKETKSSELDVKAKQAGQALRLGSRRMPSP